MSTDIYSWVPTKEEMAMLETYSHVWTEEQWAHSGNNPYVLEHERCNAIQRLVRARIHLDTNIYLVHDVDAQFGQVYLAPVPGWKHGIKPTGLKDDPLAAKRGPGAKMGKPRKGADITQMLMDAKARCDAEEAAKEAAITAEHAKRCEAVRTMNATILAEEQRKWRAAGAPPTMAERIRGVVKKPQPSWDEWQKTIVYQTEPSRATVAHEMELAPVLEELDVCWFRDEEDMMRRAEHCLAKSKVRPTGGYLMPGTWQHWEVAVLDRFISSRMAGVPY